MLVIPARYNGPAASANGGYACGLVAARVAPDAPAVEVTLRRPPPLDTPLDVSDAGLVTGPDGALVAEARVVGIPALDFPPGAALADAEGAVERYAGFREHVFPTCFVCGPARDDGLAIFPGEVAPGVVASPWRVPDDDPALVWAALDCPGAWACEVAPGRPAVLGRLTVTVHERPPPGATVVVTGWQAAPAEGRRMLAGTAVRDPDTGRVYSAGVATWVRLSPGSAASFGGS